MRKGGILFALLLLVLSSKANTCPEKIDPALGVNPSFFNMSDPTNKDIYNQNISADEKFYLLVYNTFPETQILSNIRNYNLLLPFYCPPKDTQVVGKAYIDGAWLRAITVMPSVMDEEGNYWVLPKGEVLVAHNYSIHLPRSATNSYPDCGIVYTLLNSSAQFSVYANGGYIGNFALNSYETNSASLEVKADLLVSVNVRKGYYEQDCECCKPGSEGCEEMCCSCKLSRTEVEEEQARLNSSLSRKVYWFEALPKLTMLHCGEGFGAAGGNFSLNTTVPIQSLLLSFGSTNLSLQANKLDIMPVLKPHNVLEAKSAAHGYESSRGIFVSGFNISKGFIQLNFSGVPQEGTRAPYANLAVTDLFGIVHDLSNYTRIVCPRNPQMEITMPHWAEKGSELQVIVRFSYGGRSIAGKEVVVYYSGNEYAGTSDSEGEVAFHLKANESLIEAKSQYDGEYSEVSVCKNLMVYEQSAVSLLISFLAFLFILALSYTALRFMGGVGP